MSPRPLGERGGRDANSGIRAVEVVQETKSPIINTSALMMKVMILGEHGKHVVTWQ